MAEFLADLLQRHGVKNDELLDALKWKYRKIYTEKEMVLRERDRLTQENWQLRQACGYPIPADQETPQNPFKCGTCEARTIENDRLREALEKIAERAGVYQVEGVPLVADSIGSIARAALAKEVGE